VTYSPPTISRRELLRASGLGFGSLALAGLLQADDARAERPRAPRKARAIIQLFQNGGPSQMDLFDPKPELSRCHGQPHPDGVEIFQAENKNVLFGSPFRFQKHGECGMDMSNVIPHLGTVADDLCMVRSMVSESNNHPFAINSFHTGFIGYGRPGLGSWIGYGLGTENRNLPGYVVLRDPDGYSTNGKTVWSSGWLPATYQGTEFGSSGDAVHHLNPASRVQGWARQRSLQLLAEFNERHREQHRAEAELEARIENFELAARMQIAASDVADLSKESAATRKLYGLDDPVTASYGKRTLMARRLVEAGVRFVQVFPPAKPNPQPWDTHLHLEDELTNICAATDRASAALIHDLKQRGLLDETIVMWAGEFGRLPTTEYSDGRDHNRNAFTLLLAGGGFKAGHIHGTTDEFGYRSVEDPVTVHDLHATVLELMGIDHEKLTYLQDGRPQTLTDAAVTGARVVQELLA
jgi:uncharacterized protein (DUF1501 family)